MQKVRFDSAFMFQYSQRPGTKAARHFPDDVPPEVKTRRLNEIIELQSAISLERNRECVGQTYDRSSAGRPPTRYASSRPWGTAPENMSA